MSWRRFFRRAEWDDERRRELASYVEIETDQNLARGMSPVEARRAALTKLGNPTRIREEVYRMNTIGMVDTTRRDVAYGLRLLARNPIFACVAILSLALGVGANTAIFQLINTVRLRALPVSNADRLVAVRLDNSSVRMGRFTGRYPQLSNPLWEQIRDRPSSFGSMFAFSTDRFDLASGGESRPVSGVWVSGRYFETLGVAPIAGRLFSAADDRRGCGAAAGAVISDALWTSEFGRDPLAIGRLLHVNGHPFPVLGVTPASFFGVEAGHRFDVALLLCAEPVIRGEESALDERGWWWLSVIGRLKDGVTTDVATTELQARSSAILAATLPPSYPPDLADRYRKTHLVVVPAASGVSDLRTKYGTPLTLLLSIAGLVLLIACGNLASLMLARASAREREMAVRLAIGASRGALVRQLMIESALVAAGGAMLGGWLALSLSRLLVSFLRSDDPTLFVDLHVDWTMVAFTTALALTTCLVFGLVPAIRATRTAPSSVLRAGGRGAIEGGRFTLRRALVAGQLAVSLVLVVAALLFLTTLRNLSHGDSGLVLDGVTVADFDLNRANVPTGRRLEFNDALLSRIRRLPGVVDAAGALVTPLSGSSWNEALVLDGKRQPGICNVNEVTPHYFAVLGMHLEAGRDFSASDTITTSPKAIVSRSFAATYFHEPAPIGRTFRFQQPPNESPVTYEIVGVVSDAKYVRLRESAGPVAYVSASQQASPGTGVTYLIRSAPGAPVGASIVSAARDTDPSIIVAISSLSQQVADSLVAERLMAVLSGFFGALAGLLAAIGLYGVMSYTVTVRRQEIGIRMALGADRAGVLWMVLREAAALIGSGVVAGTVVAAAVAQYAAELLFGLQPRDPLIFATAIGLLCGVGLLATLLPARRASKLDPYVALRDS